MNKILKKLISLSLFLLAVLSFSACGGAPDVPTVTDGGSAATTEPSAETTAAVKKSEDCIIVYHNSCFEYSTKVQGSFEALTGVAPKTYTNKQEYEETAFEIHIGNTKKAEKVYAELGEDEYGVRVFDDNGELRVFIMAENPIHMELAVDVFVKQYLSVTGNKLKKTEATLMIGEKSIDEVGFEDLEFEDELINVVTLVSSTYARMATLNDGRIICTYGAKGSGDPTSQIYATFSSDKGLTWSESVPVTGAIDPPELICANGVPYQLEDGTILVGYRANEKKVNGTKTYHSSIRVMQSKDGGKTWERHSIVWDLYEENIVYNNSFGLWEPHFGILNGELACFFAIGKNVYNYNHIINSVDIFVWRQVDGEWKWVRAEYTSTETPGAVKNGMPIWQDISEGGYIVAVESTVNQSTQYKNVLTTKLLTSKDGIHWVNQCDVYVPDLYKRRSAAPYIVQLPDGRFVVSYMTDEDLDEPSNDGQMMIKLSVSKKGLTAYDLTGEESFIGPYNVFGTPVGYRSTYAGMMVDGEYLYVYSWTDHPYSRVVLRRARLVTE